MNKKFFDYGLYPYVPAGGEGGGTPPDLSKYALKTDVDKVKTDLTAAIGKKADASALAGKADKTALDAKADKTALAAKADATALTALEKRVAALEKGK